MSQEVVKKESRRNARAVPSKRIARTHSWVLNIAWSTSLTEARTCITGPRAGADEDVTLDRVVLSSCLCDVNAHQVSDKACGTIESSHGGRSTRQGSVRVAS